MERGDIYFADLEPTFGREQAGRRPVMVITRADHNRTNPPVIAPITSVGNHARYQGYAVSLAASGTVTIGVVLCNQIRVVDLNARRARFVERAPDDIIDDVLARVQTLLD